MATDSKPMHVLLFQNGMLAVFDQYDEQMPGLQGYITEHVEDLVAACTPETRIEVYWPGNFVSPEALREAARIYSEGPPWQRIEVERG